MIHLRLAVSAQSKEGMIEYFPTLPSRKMDLLYHFHNAIINLKHEVFSLLPLQYSLIWLKKSTETSNTKQHLLVNEIKGILGLPVSSYMYYAIWQ